MPEPAKPTDKSKSVSASASVRRAVGRKLLAEPGKLWSALPIEWPTATEADLLAEAAGDREITQLPGTFWRFFYTVRQLLVRPRRSFDHVHEPVSHGAVLKFLAGMRLPLWLVAIVPLAATLGNDPAPLILRPVHDVLDPQLVSAASLWLLLMIPVGLPLLYFVSGLTTHVALTLTGGAPRSIAATMRATGYAMAVPLLVVAVLDLLTYTDFVEVPATAYLAGLAALALIYIRQLAYTLSGTHNISLVRCVFVALVPVAVLAGLTFARGYLLLVDFPGWSPHLGSRYFVP